MQAITYSNPCPGIASGMPGYLLTQLLQTLLSTHCFFGNPKDYPEDFASDLKNNDRFDFIVIGGGSAGSVIANRLSEEKNWRVLLLEAGGTPAFESDIPGFTFSTLGGAMDWNYKSEPDDKSCLSMEGKRCHLPKGKVLGGSSAINLMHYIRGNPEDYDEWERLGNVGWNFADVLHYFKKSEKIHSDFKLVNDTDYDTALRAILKTVKGNDKSTYEFSKLLPEDYHSADGILPVNHFSYDFYLQTLKKTYCYAVDEVGMDCVSDVNGFNQSGFVHALGSLEKGMRANTARAFLNPVKSRPNLFVARETHVSKLVLDGKRVVGVEVTKKGSTVKLFAEKEVILSAGAFNSPKILMLSGIGPKDHLRSLNIPLVRDLPGVGKNLQAHVTFFGMPVSIDNSLPEPLKLLQKFDGIYEFLTRGSGLYGNICMNDFVGFVSTMEKAALPDIQLLHFLNHLNDTYLFNELFKALGINSHVTDQFAEFSSASKVMLVCPTILRPKSRGEVSLKSSRPEDDPKMTMNFLSEEDDIETLLRGIKVAVNLLKTESFQVMEAKLLKLEIPDCESHEFGKNEYWRCLVRHISTSLHDYAGTCKMGQDDMAVVDNTLKVLGVNGLRVADSSVMPVIIRGSTHTAAIMIGEKASDMVKREWKTGSVHDEM